MINGAHMVIYSADPAADRAFLRDVLGFSGVDAGDGWLIFALPPAEIACHPAETGGSHEIYLMCDDIVATADDLKSKGVDTAPPTDEGWGLLSSITLPSGAKLGIYEPRHPRPDTHPDTGA